MRNWDAYTNNDFLGNPTIGDDICPQEKDYNDAKAVAEKLGIPLLRVDFIKEYWDYVFTYFIEEYKKGRSVFNFFVGQVMKQTRGQANPSLTAKIIKEEEIKQYSTNRIEIEVI